jgi:hypothetical protein
MQWSPDKLAAAAPRLLVQAQWSANQWFMFYDVHSDSERAADLLEDTAASGQFSNELSQVPLQDFVANMSSAGYHRLTGMLNSGGSLNHFESAVQPFDDLIVGLPNETVLSFWMGSANTTTHTHYDVDHNFFVQLFGRKRFTIFAPSESANLYLFPEMHPRARKSQVTLEHPDESRFPRFRHAQRLSVIVEHGDVLYIPPVNISIVFCYFFSHSYQRRILANLERVFFCVWKCAVLAASCPVSERGRGDLRLGIFTLAGDCRARRTASHCSAL